MHPLQEMELVKEVVPEAQKILKEVANQHQFKLQIDEFDFSSCDYYEKHGKMLPDDWKDKDWES